MCVCVWLFPSLDTKKRTSICEGGSGFVLYAQFYTYASHPVRLFAEENAKEESFLMNTNDWQLTLSYLEERERVAEEKSVTANDTSEDWRKFLVNLNSYYTTIWSKL